MAGLIRALFRPLPGPAGRRDCPVCRGPKEPGLLLCGDCRGDLFSPEENPRFSWYGRIYRSARHQGAFRTAMIRLKAGRHTDLAPVFSHLMAQTLLGALAPGETLPGMVTFVPGTRLRDAQRGFAPAGLLARHLGRSLDRPVVPLLVRSGGVPQRTLDRARRQENLRGAFRPKTGDCIIIRGARLLLVDDVLTTGATLAAAAGALRAMGAGEIWGVVCLERPPMSTAGCPEEREKKPLIHRIHRRTGPGPGGAGGRCERSGSGEPPTGAVDNSGRRGELYFS